jgi:cell division protein FtsB
VSSSILRPIAALAALAGLAAYATIMLRGPHGLSALSEKRHEIRTLEEQNANLTRDIDAKKQRIQRLINDPSTQEVEVQKRLGRVHPGDTEFKVPGQHNAPVAPKQP